MERRSSGLLEPKGRVGEWAVAQMKLPEGHFGARCRRLEAQEQGARFIIIFYGDCYTTDKVMAMRKCAAAESTKEKVLEGVGRSGGSAGS